ncbi:MAG: magnesium-translocating P-type ATPase [Clostridiales bacterium]|nr:magnesium-translocating P-type ATPase [Clostridiales bacterium]
MYDFSQKPPQDILRDLGMTDAGLDDALEEHYREKYGDNHLTGEKSSAVSHSLRRAFLNPFVIVLLLLAIIAFFTDVVYASNSSRNITTVAIIVVMLLVSGIVRFAQEMRSRKITDSLVQLVDTTVQVKHAGEWQERPSDRLVVGDIVRLEAGDRVPADIRVTKASDFFVTQSVITGESGIIEKTADVLRVPPKRIPDYTNSVFLGSTVTGGSGEGIVLAVGADTVYGGIAPENSGVKDGFDRGENSIALVLIKYMVILAPIIFIACGITKGNWIDSLLFAISVAVGIAPELLPMVITACLARGSSQMGKKMTIVKNINAMQGFGSMDILCVDKTGTLTGDVVKLEYYMDVLGNESQTALDCAYLNSYYHTGVSNHLDAAVLGARESSGMEEHFSSLTQAHEKLDELPFDYNRKFASVLLRGAEGNFLIVKGAVDEVAARCTRIAYQGEFTDIEPDGGQSVMAVVGDMLSDGMKVLAVAGKRLDKDAIQMDDEHEMTLLGYLAFFDAPKQSAAEAIKKLGELHLGVKILTGDREDVAASVCRRLGIAADNVMTGAEFDELSDNDFQIRAEQGEIFADLSPRQKADIVTTLRENGHVVGFLGDGMNDLPAIVGADVGISVDTATDAVRDSADVVLLKKDLNVLGDGVLEGRRAFANMTKYIKITASSNFGTVCAIAVASIFLPFFPITAVQFLLLTLLYDILCLALPWDKVDPEMSEWPMEWSGRTLGRFMLSFGPISTVFDILTFVFMYFVLCPIACGGGYHALGADMQAQFMALFQTGWFLESIWTQVLILHLLRTRRFPFVDSVASTPVVLVTVFGTVLFTVLAMTGVGRLLGMTALPAVYFLFLVVTVILYLLVVTIVKRIYLNHYGDLL